MGWARDPPSAWGRRDGLGTRSSLSVGEEGWAGHEILPQRGGGGMGWARDPPSAWGRRDGLGTKLGSSLSVGEERWAGQETGPMRPPHMNGVGMLPDLDYPMAYSPPPPPQVEPSPTHCTRQC